MADWIHCNMCFIQPREGDANFVLTSCGHVLCVTCENRENAGECRICKAPCSIIKLRSDVLPNVKEYFEEPLVIAERLIKAIRFQKGHRTNLFKAYSKHGEKYQKAKAHIQKMELHIQKLESQIRKLDSHSRKLEKKVEYYEKQISPASTIESFNFTPYSNKDSESQSHFFNSARTQQTTIETPRFLKPGSSSAFKQYRYEAEYTPASASPYNDSTPPSHSTADYRSARNSNQSQTQTARSQPKYPMRTPPYSALNNLRIAGSRK